MCGAGRTRVSNWVHVRRTMRLLAGCNRFTTLLFHIFPKPNPITYSHLLAHRPFKIRVKIYTDWPIFASGDGLSGAGSICS